MLYYQDIIVSRRVLIYILHVSRPTFFAYEFYCTKLRNLGVQFQSRKYFDGFSQLRDSRYETRALISFSVPSMYP